MTPSPGIEDKIVSAMNVAISKVGGIGRVIGSTLYLPGAGDERARKPGAPAGIEHMAEIDAPPAPGEVLIERVDFGPEQIEWTTEENVEACFGVPRPEWCAVRWYDVRGLHPYVVNHMRKALAFHTLAAEDVMHVPQRPRLESYGDYLFVVTRLLDIAADGLKAEQMSMFLFSGVVVTFQADTDDSWAPLRQRLQDARGKLRTSGPDFLLYALLDTVVDHCFPILDEFHETLEDLEDDVALRPRPGHIQRIQDIKRQLAVVRRLVWPTRDLVDHLIRNEDGLISDQTRVYLRDVHGHTKHLVDVIETLREMAAGLTDLYLSAASHQSNETMRVLTIMASIFIPITFLAGVYGMNFHYMPELDQRWAYPSFWAICSVVIVSLLVWFRRKGWLGGSDKD